MCIKGNHLFTIWRSDFVYFSFQYEMCAGMKLMNMLGEQSDKH